MAEARVNDCDDLSSPNDSGVVELIEKLMKSRVPVAGWVTRYSRALDRAIVENDAEKANSLTTKLKLEFDKLEGIHCKILEYLTSSCSDESTFSKFEDWFANYEELYTSCISKVTQFNEIECVENNDERKSDIVDSDDKCELTKLVNCLSLPKLELQVFDGNPLMYQSFILLFDELVTCKIDDDNAKLSRLLQYTSGPANLAIRNCVLCPDGFNKARDILKNRFGNKHLVAQKIF